ncbi:hypothetical protein KR222_000774 [Zaprionus bogoriensis]|nr:hypothetical protein KR222_000774 [Zaprionus bogoriensis]
MADIVGQMQLLGEMLPRLELLHVVPSVGPPFPSNLQQLRLLHLQHSISQLMFDQICELCPQLQHLYLRNELEPHTALDITSVAKCLHLRELQLPLLLRPPHAVCHLRYLRHLSLQRQQLWPGMEWLPHVREVISLKRYELQSLCFDGSWLTAPLDLALLQLQHCWALRELLLSNCKLANQQAVLELPLSCQRLSLQNCTLSRQLCYLKGQPQLRLLELYKCQLPADGGQMLLQLVRQRQRLPTLYPLLLRFKQSTLLRAELNSWTQARRRYWEEWLQVREVHEDELTWRHQLATITMTFGTTVSFTPDMNSEQACAEPTPAELLRELGMIDS